MATTELTTPQPDSSRQTSVSLYDYLRVVSLISIFVVGLVIVSQTTFAQPSPQRLMAPMIALVLLTALVWLLMVVVRNASVWRGLASPEYYVAYNGPPPAEWIERPARTFNNLMQVPPLFHVICLLMISQHTVDGAQLVFAWVYVAMRVVHAVISIGWNYVPYRFAAWSCSCIVLGVLWTRFALQAWPEF